MLGALTLLFAICASALSGCTLILVDEYDKESETKLLAAYEKVSRHYDDLVYRPPAERRYEEFSRSWAEIATDLRVLLLRQRARAHNTESIQIVEKLLENWQRTRNEHKRRSGDPDQQADPYKESLIALDREQFEGQFAAAVAAELFKK